MTLSPPGWSIFFQALFFGFWLPLILLPFFSALGGYAVTETALARFRAIKKPLSRHVTLAVMVGTRLRLGLLVRCNGRYNYVGDEPPSGEGEGIGGAHLVSRPRHHQILRMRYEVSATGRCSAKRHSNSLDAQTNGGPGDESLTGEAPTGPDS